VAEAFDGCRLSEDFGTLTADIEVHAIELLKAGTLESLTIAALIVNDGQMAVRRYIRP
jgi:hypothetical protein